MLSLLLALRVRPNAKETKITGFLDDGTVKIDLHALAEDGKANAELLRFIAEHYGVAKENVRIVSGLKSRKKVVRISVNKG